MTDLKVPSFKWVTKGLCKLCTYLGTSHHTLIFYLFTVGPDTELLYGWKESLATRSLEARDQVSLSTYSLAGINIFSPPDLKTIQILHCMHEHRSIEREESWGVVKYASSLFMTMKNTHLFISLLVFLKSSLETEFQMCSLFHCLEPENINLWPHSNSH